MEVREDASGVGSRRHVLKHAAAAVAGAGVVGLMAPAPADAATPPSYNVQDAAFGAQGDGVTDDTVAVQATINAAASTGLQGGIVFFPSGIYSCRPLTIPTGVHLRGTGVGDAASGGVANGTTLVLRGASPDALLTTAGFSGLTGTNNTAGPTRFGVHDMLLDGNKASNPSRRVIQFFGSGFQLENVKIINAGGEALYSEWGQGGGDSMEAIVTNFRIQDGTSHGIVWKGPHDSQFINGEVIRCPSGSKGIWTTGNASGEQFAQVHVWGTQSYGWYVERPAFLTACVSEGSSTANLAVLASDIAIAASHFFNAPIGIQWGSATISPSRCMVDAKVSVCSTAALQLLSDPGFSHIRLTVNIAVGTHALQGSPGPLTHLELLVDGNGTNAGWFRTGAQQKVGFFGVAPVGQAPPITTVGSGDWAAAKQAFADIRKVLHDIGITA